MTYTQAEIEFELDCDFSISIIFSYERANEVVETTTKLKSLVVEFEKITAAEAKGLDELRQYARCLEREVA